MILIKNVQGSNQQERLMGKQKDCTERSWLTRTQAKKALHAILRLEAQRIASVNMCTMCPWYLCQEVTPGA